MTASSSDAVTASEARIIEHIEYYFDDFSLSRNNFLKEKIQEDDGWVTIDNMLNFKRLKKITDNAQMICEALKKSTSGLMEVSEQGDKIRRSPSKPFPGDIKKRQKAHFPRTVYAKPFPLDVKLGDLLEFFEGFGQLDKVFMKKNFHTKTFNGSVFVTFANKEDATKFVNEKETKFKEQALEIKCSKTKYLRHKAANKKAYFDRTVYVKPFPLDVKLDDLLEFFGGYGQLDKVFMKKHFQKKTFKGSVFVTFANVDDATKFVNEKETKFKEQALEVKCSKTKYLRHKAAQKKANGKTYTEGKPHKNGGDETKEEETEADLEERVSQMMTENAVLKGLNPETSREFVKAIFSKHADVALVDLDNGGTQAYIVIREAESASSMLETAKTAIDGKVVIQGSEIEVRFAEGDEELQYWKKMFKDRKICGGSCRRQGERNQRDERNNRDERRNSEGQQGKRNKNKNEDSNGGGSNGEEQDTEETPAKMNKSEMVITRPHGKRKQNKQDASSDLEEQDTEEPPVKVIKSEMIISRSQGKRKQNKKHATSGGEEQDTEEPPAKEIKSEMVIKFKEVLKYKEASSGGEEHDTEEPPAKVAKSEIVITRPQGRKKQNKRDASSGGEEEDTEEPPANVTKSEIVITRPQGRKKQNKKDDSSGGEAVDKVEPPARVNKSQVIITRPQGNRKQKKKVDSSGEEQDTEEPPAKVTKSEIVMTRPQGRRKQNKKDASSGGEEDDMEEPPARVIKSEMIIMFQ